MLMIMIFICSCGSSGVDVDQVAYYRDQGPNRVFTYQVNAEASYDEIKAHCEKQMHTKGQLTQVFYYKRAAPDVTLAVDYVSAANDAYDAKPYIRCLCNSADEWSIEKYKYE